MTRIETWEHRTSLECNKHNRKVNTNCGTCRHFSNDQVSKPILHLTKSQHISLPSVLWDMQEAVEGVPHLEQDGNRSRMEPTNLKASYRTNGAETERMYRRVLGAERRLRTTIKDNRAGDLNGGIKNKT